MDSKIFKANDIRGKYPQEINEKAVFEIAGSLAGYFKKGKSKRVKVVVTRDVRLSSPALSKAVLQGLDYSNVLKNIRIKKIKIIDAGATTTPMFYFLVNKLKADGGIMVTASHNPKNYNGLKVVERNAVPISGEDIKQMVYGK